MIELWRQVSIISFDSFISSSTLFWFSITLEKFLIDCSVRVSKNTEKFLWTRDSFALPFLAHDFDSRALDTLLLLDRSRLLLSTSLDFDTIDLLLGKGKLFLFCSSEITLDASDSWVFLCDTNKVCWSHFEWNGLRLVGSFRLGYSSDSETSHSLSLTEGRSSSAN